MVSSALTGLLSQKKVTRRRPKVGKLTGANSAGFAANFFFLHCLCAGDPRALALAGAGSFIGVTCLIICSKITALSWIGDCGATSWVDCERTAHFRNVTVASLGRTIFSFVGANF